MKVAICSAHTMDGPLMDVVLVLKSPRRHQKAQNLGLISHLEHVLQGSLLWCLKASSLFGQMRMVGNEPMPLHLQGSWFRESEFVAPCVHLLFNWCVIIPSLSLQLPRLPDDFDKPEFSSVTIQRDLFYGYDTLMENVSDPSHIDFAHHKVRDGPSEGTCFN